MRRNLHNLQDGLDVLLRDQPKDEKQGATATQGFGFQQWWGALCVAELLRTQEDFAVGIEVKDDIALLDSSTLPTKIEFCQVKKNEQAGGWTLKELHQKGKKLKSGGFELSTLAKLYKRRQEFDGYSITLRFVSNVSFKVPAEDNSMVNAHEVHLDALLPAQKKVLQDTLGGQLGLVAEDISLNQLHLHRTNLPLGQQEVFVGGKLSQLCEQGLIGFPIPQPTVAARMLASELQSKASSTSYARSFDELKVRLLTRADALNTLAMLAQAKPTLSTVLDEAIERLNIEKFDFLALKRIKAERVQVCADAMDRTNLLFRNLVRTLIGAYHIVSQQEAGKMLGELMEKTILVARNNASSEFFGRNADYVNALTLLVLNDGIDINLYPTTTGQKSEVEE